MQFKAELVATCLQSGASIAATAREHGMNANVLHRWLKEHRQGQHQIICDTAPAVACDLAAHGDDAAAVPVVNAPPVGAPAHRPQACAIPAFIAVALDSPVMESSAAKVQAASSAASTSIRIECCYHGTRVTVNWPVATAAECSSALQGLLQVLRQCSASRLPGWPRPRWTCAPAPALARVVAVFGAAHPHHAYLFANKRANRIKVLVHDGTSI